MILKKVDDNFSLMTKEDILLSVDRLTRFKNPQIKYRRVFFDIVSKHALISKKQLDAENPEKIVKYVEKIWNSSVLEIFGKNNHNSEITFKYFDDFHFNIKDEYTNVLMKAKLNIPEIFSKFTGCFRKKNLDFCLEVCKSPQKDYENSRFQNSLLFPLKKVIISEGITEEILLPVFAQITGNDFDKNGIYLLSAGGKSKVTGLYNELKDILKIPVMILLDNDAKSVFEELNGLLRNCDKAFLLSGEFEDALPLKLIKRTVNNSCYDCPDIKCSDLKSDSRMSDTLTEIYKNIGAGEFRKAKFAKAVAENIQNEKDLSEELINFFNILNSLNIKK